MLDTDVCSDLSARCGGKINIGLWCGEQLCEAFTNSFDFAGRGIEVKYKDSACGVHLYFAEGDGAESSEFFSRTDGKPRAVVYADASLQSAAEEVAARCNCPAAGFDFSAAEEGLNNILRILLFEFPLRRIDVDIPEWTQVMPQENTAIAELLSAVTERSSKIFKMSELSDLDGMFAGAKYWKENAFAEADLKTGCVKLKAEAKDGIYFEMLSEIAGDEIDGEYSLMRFVRSASQAKKGYAKVKDALECAGVNGYGIVQPSEDDIVYDTPSVIRQGGNVGIKLKASAPSYHIIRVDVSGEVNPIMGSAAQSENMVQGMMAGFERNAEEMWNTDLFGKSLKSMVQEGLAAKVSSMQEETRGKLRRAVNRMVNEGKGGAIVIIL
ncbi:MAG: hypothetical protein LUD27_02015 [Clostridia bacterium]|nr:hypothetical protein [Clostridia bacterium]